ncbi:MAG TPA: tetratricopeptide repeat protein [Acetobacteraceae bacterium]|nr:tetratricopeptide repeat protein [Acetobacteraceae bacterium]
MIIRIPPRAALLAGVLLLLAAGAGGMWWRARHRPAPQSSTEAAPLPVPPLPPRIAQGPEYEHCLDMLGSDPAGANDLAESWEATGGGDGAKHCRALAQIALGDPATGAAMLEALGGSSTAAGAARAAIYGQATQAWIMAGDANRAYGSATLALSLSPDDPELLIDRAIAAAQLEQFAEATDDLTRALALDPRRPDALVYRAAAWRHLDQPARAEADIDRAIALDPGNADALLERGILRQLRGDRDGARADWEQAEHLDPDSATADLAQQDLALLDAGPSQQ